MVAELPVAERREASSSSDAPRRVGIFGGSFNPPHVAHLMASVYALSNAPIDEVLVVPVFKHPFAKELAPFEHRLRMCELGLGWIPGVTVSAVERDLGGESLTLRTLERLREDHPSWAMRLLIGSDVLPDLPKWHRFSEVEKLAPPFVLERAGASDSQVVLPDVSSTQVRSLFADASDDSQREDAERAKTLLARLVPEKVLAYAIEERLYRGLSSSPPQ